MTTIYGPRPGIRIVPDAAHATLEQCEGCRIALTDENRHDYHDALCVECGERKDQRDHEAQEDRIVDAAREREMFREWGGR